jgi:hypothetical protein
MALGAKHEAPPVGATANVLLDSLGSFKFWRIQKPNAARLLKEIIFRWRGASAYVPGRPGKWVVWPRERWCEWTGLSRNQLDRALKELVQSSLIDRERHRFAGSEVRTFLRPTAVALKYLGRPQDTALAVLASEKVSEKSTEKTSEKASEKISEKISEKTDYTSIPSVPTSPTNSTSSTTTEQTQPSTPLNNKGKGNAGEDDEIDNKFVELLAKKQIAADKLYPEKLGPHQKSVKHPSKMFPNWLSYSTKVQNTLYQKYLVYIDNWNKGKNGSVYSNFDGWTDEDETALLADHEKKLKAKAAAGG